LKLKTRKESLQIVHHALLAHGLACQATRDASPAECNVATAENLAPLVPVIETAAHITAAQRAFVAEEPNAGILILLLTGR